MTTPAPTFRVGDTVIEPTIGVCRVQGIRQMVVDGTKEDYFIFQAPSARVMVPRSQMEKRGIRRPMTKDDIKKITLSLRQPVNPTRSDARTQYLEYQETLKSGNPLRISKLLRGLFILDQTDQLKGKEKELMEQARKFLIEEITFIKGTPKGQISKDINDSLVQMYKKKLASDAEPAKEKKAAAKK